MSLTASALFSRLTTRAKLRHMQALLTLNELRSMGRAAEAMGMTQPAMSQLVAELEKLIETQLFFRHSKGIDPTPAALDLLPVARRILAATEEGADRIASLQRREGGLVRIASTASSTGAILDPMIAKFGEQNSNIHAQILTVVGPSLDASFTGDEFDVVLCRERALLPEGWQFQCLVPDGLAIMTGPNHPLALKDRVTLDDLRASTWVQHQATSLAREHFDLLRERLDWHEIKLVHVASRIPTIAWSMLRDSSLVSLVPRSVVMPWIREGLLCEIDAGLEMPLLPMGYHWRPDRAGPAATRFLEALKAAFLTGKDCS
jgi:DNA-binding transcriptional LysR family regulator